MNVRKMQMLERVLDVLDMEEVSDERVGAFREAASLYYEWRKSGGDEVKE